jgi:hypothetical protein
MLKTSIDSGALNVKKNLPEAVELPVPLLVGFADDSQGLAGSRYLRLRQGSSVHY